MSNNTITNTANPVNLQDVATKNYIDNIVFQSINNYLLNNSIQFQKLLFSNLNNSIKSSKFLLDNGQFINLNDYNIY